MGKGDFFWGGVVLVTFFFFFCFFPGKNSFLVQPKFGSASRGRGAFQSELGGGGKTGGRKRKKKDSL